MNLIDKANTPAGPKRKTSLYKNLGGAALMAFLTVAPFAAQAGQLIDGCHPTAKMQEMLKAQEQKPVIIGNAISDTGKKSASMITSNPDGSLGYYLEGDAPMDGKASKFCVSSAFTNIKMYSPSLTEPPQEAFLGGTKEQATKACVDEKRSRCGWYDEGLISAYKNGARLLMRGNTIIEKDGQILASNRVADFAANIEKKYGGLSYGYPATGIGISVSVLMNFQVMPQGEALLGKQIPSVQMATINDPATNLSAQLEARAP